MSHNYIRNIIREELKAYSVNKCTCGVPEESSSEEPQPPSGELYEAILDLVKEAMGANYPESYYGEKNETAAEIAKKIYNLK